ncbi:MAG: bifunctional phosphopantothenoylcysteine decarboxylase/phosphopantothenate--cysteine ligase CoaBC [Selenomonadaceae bacterium]|nr:bifunctional phosphopantothenoylcysteine decarboxylase/phosphopantothenate--cysteine ligase CoaBC [Selenomonadaceae bacterium]
MTANAAALKGKNVILGVTGGIAAYKAVELASRLRKIGAEVHVIMTRGAQSFVTELTFREISGHPVSTGMWEKVSHWQVEHIALARLADLVLVAPATANIIAKAAHGLADDMLTTVLLATEAPICFAPAMNSVMWENPLTQRNIKILRELGYHVITPASGHLACGVEGVGRLPEPEAILEEAVNFALARGGVNNTLTGRKILVTAGGTIAPIDPVRFIANRSSGKMGYAIAREAARRGAETVLVSGPTALPEPVGVKTVQVETTEEMRAAVLKGFPTADAVIKAAAVADYVVKEVAAQKIKKTADEWCLELKKAPDILWELGQKKKPWQVLVGFAAETESLVEYAKAKLAEKNLDFIVANDVTRPGAGFNTDTNIAQLIFRDGKREEHPLLTKEALAEIILDRVASLLPPKRKLQDREKG